LIFAITSYHRSQFKPIIPATEIANATGFFVAGGVSVTRHSVPYLTAEQGSAEAGEKFG
jgi:hypothetical protein